jgi:hypothetical protein
LDVFRFYGLTFYNVKGSFLSKVLDFVASMRTNGDRKKASDHVKELLRGPAKDVVEPLVSRMEIVGKAVYPTRVADYVQLRKLLPYVNKQAAADAFGDEAEFMAKVKAIKEIAAGAVAPLMDVEESIVDAEEPAADALVAQQPEDAGAGALAVPQPEDAGPRTLQ